MIKQTLASKTSWVLLLVLSLLALPAIGQDKTSPAPSKPSDEPGLRGLLSVEVPEELTDDALSDLEGQWTPVREKLNGLLTRLYEEEKLNVAGQRKVLGELKQQVKLIRNRLGQPESKPIRETLITVHGQLTRRIGVAEALLDTLTNASRPKPMPAPKSSQTDLNATAVTLQRYLASFTTGSTWADYLQVSAVVAASKKKTLSRDDIELLKGVQKKLHEKQKLGDEAQISFLEEPKIAAMEKALDAYFTGATKKEQVKPRSTGPVSVELIKKLRPHLATLASAINVYEQTASRTAATRARQVLKTIRDTAPGQGEQLGEALREHYFGYNLRIVASERLLNRYVGQTRVEKQPVRDVILDAQVSGDSTTTARVGVELLASQDGARWKMLLDGKTISDTRADKKGASVYTHGEHTFSATKEVLFDGDKFTSKPARIDVDANNTIVDVQAKSKLVLRIARKKAAKLKPETEAIAARKVAEDVAPRFNKEVDEQFQKATRDLADHVNGPLKELDLAPSARSVTSTENELRVSSRLMGSGELAGSLQNPPVTSDKGLVLHVHESAINNAIDRLELHGKTMTEEELKHQIEDVVSTFLGREFHFSASDAKSADETGSTTLIFADDDPVRVRISGGQLVLVIQAGLKQEAGKEDIPAQVVTVPISLKLDKKNIVVSRGSVKVSAVSRPKSRTKQIVRAGVVRKKISKSITDRMIERQLVIPRDDADSIELSVTRIVAVDGWLSVVFE